MSGPKISVIMPIYNVEEFLEESLDCLVNQTFIDDMEVIMIDDGSDDESRYIIEKYALDYPNFYAYHKSNQGPSFTRNMGLDLAKGEYIAFFDGDDYIDLDWYEKLYEMIVNNNSDIVTAPIIRLRRYNVFDGFFYKNCFKKICSDIESATFMDVPELIWDLFITNKLYRKDFICRNNLRFLEENKAYCDDTPFSLNAYLLADKISVVTDVYYYWRYRESKTYSNTQKINHIKNFKDRLYAIELYGMTFDELDVDEKFKESFYLKILNYDLYVHFSKFHLYDEEFYQDIIDESKIILKTIPQKSKNGLNTYKTVMYKMVENNAIDELYEFTKAGSDIKENQIIPDNLSNYESYIDFEHDAVFEELTVKRENIYMQDSNLIIEFSEKINYLPKSYPHRTAAKLVDGTDEHLLDVEGEKIIIPIDVLSNKKHSKIKIEYICDNFKKENYLVNNKRDILEFDDFDIEIGIATNRLLVIDIRPTNDLLIEIDDVSFNEGIFEFTGLSNQKISDIFIRNVVTFEKISYRVNSFNNGNDYEISFSVPFDDIISYPVRKWELIPKSIFKKIRLNKKFEFYNRYDFIYMINARNKILISNDIYNSLDKLTDNLNQINELKTSRKELKRINVELKKDNKKLLKENKKLEKKNQKLNEKNHELENKIINVNPIKTKLFKK